MNLGSASILVQNSGSRVNEFGSTRQQWSKLKILLDILGVGNIVLWLIDIIMNLCILHCIIGCLQVWWYRWLPQAAGPDQGDGGAAPQASRPVQGEKGGSGKGVCRSRAALAGAGQRIGFARPVPLMVFLRDSPTRFSTSNYHSNLPGPLTNG